MTGRKQFLVGMPGSGKSYWAKRLGDYLRVPSIDADERIAQRCGQSIPELFERFGEAYFREREAEVLEELCAEPGDAIVATGGGMPCYHDGMHKMKRHGCVIYLEAVAKRDPSSAIARPSAGKNPGIAGAARGSVPAGRRNSSRRLVQFG